jgi:hypothetical protein
MSFCRWVTKKASERMDSTIDKVKTQSKTMIVPSLKHNETSSSFNLHKVKVLPPSVYELGSTRR